MTTKQAIFDAIEQLPEQQLKDVLQYVQKLAGTLKSPTSNPPTQSSDPLAGFICVVSHGSLAANLDEELYGD
ncbi:hypothetical protein [Nostoc sp. UHCC 0251]|uniref:hypothetical protein n=1 Tax=Nostoc sp. UHCC 0251 TaxID=3110240 RepID=UPI002B1F3085|nr:hypothetical protein [Nostoc sp. UHCC 0251]MEA5627209.1 hypothetical protein [Nostoc sp. UHCC 0251]